MTESLVSRFIKGTLSIGLGSAAGMILGFVSVAVAVRLVTPEEYGAFVLLQVAFTFLTEVSGFGLTMAVSKFVTSAGEDEQPWRIINTALYARILAILGTCVILYFTGSWIAWLFDSPESSLVTVIQYLPILLALESMGKFFKATLQCRFRFKWIGMVEILSSLFNLVFIGIFMISLPLGLTGLIYAKICSLFLAYLSGYLASSIRHRLVFDLSILREMLAFGMPLQFNYILSFVFMRIDTIVIGAMLGPSGVAFYEVARRIPDSLMRLTDAFHAVYFPFISSLFAQQERETATKVLNNSTRWLSFITILGALIALLFGNEIFILLFTDVYLASVPAFVIMMVSLNLTIVEKTLGYSLVAIGDSGKPVVINIVRSLASLGGNIVVIPLYGFVGAALVSVAANVLSIPLNMVFLWKREMYAKFGDYLIPILVFAACGVCGFYGAQVIGPSSLLYTYLFKVVMILVFLVICVMLSVIKQDDVTALTQMTVLRQRFSNK